MRSLKWLKILKTVISSSYDGNRHVADENENLLMFFFKFFSLVYRLDYRPEN